MILLDIITDAIFELWLWGMELIIPERAKKKHTLTIIKVIFWIFICILFGMMVIGFFAVLNDDPVTKQFGKYMLFISLGISAVQIVAGIILRKASKKKK